jgi:hypothetical protein
VRGRTLPVSSVCTTRIFSTAVGTVSSTSDISSSWSFSPGRSPVKTIGTSRYTARAPRAEQVLREVDDRTGSPISSMVMRPAASGSAAACSTSCTASGIVMK